MTLLSAFADFITGFSAASLPSLDRQVLRRHVTDVVAARIAGAACSEGRAVAAFYPPNSGAEAIAAYTALVRLTETDDIHTPSGTTPSSVAVPVALALAAAEPCSAERLESAILIGVETIVRLGMAVGGAQVLYQGLWPTRTGATLGAAATACRVWGLTRAQTEHAMSLAALLTSGRTGRFQGEPSGRWIILASSVAGGIRAAEAARQGFVSDLSLYDTNWLERALGVPVNAKLLADGLGGSSVFAELSLKPYCTSRQALPGAEAMRALIADGVRPETIESFTIKVPQAYAQMISMKLDPKVRSSSYVSGTGLAAIAALDPQSLTDVERAKVADDPDILALAKKGEIVADPSLDALYPKQWPARIEIRAAGRVNRYDVFDPLGSPANPMDDAPLAAKVEKVLGHVERGQLAKPLLALTEAPFETDAAAKALARFFVDEAM